MDLVVSSFPLLNLPNKSLMHVIRNMEIRQQIGLSLCSETTKTLIKSLNLKANYFDVTLENNEHRMDFGMTDNTWVVMEFYMDEISIEKENNDDLRKNLSQPGFLTADYCDGARYDDTVYVWKKGQFTIEDWIKYLMEIVNYSKIDNLRIEKKYFHIDFIEETYIGIDFKELIVYQRGDMDPFGRILYNFSPIGQLELAHNLFDEGDVNKILMKNLNCFKVCFCYKLTLNELLMINSLYVYIERSIFTEKELNQFIKHWMAGSNPRLKHIIISFHNQNFNIPYENSILKGIDYYKVPDDQERTYRRWEFITKVFENETINGGFDIQRKNGIKATIHFKQDNDDDMINFHNDPNIPMIHFKMIVWD